tara:strand:+ start:568 stop:1017 length:450 start_codon:yes stop_codon:yes gene_type:complete
MKNKNKPSVKVLKEKKEKDGTTTTFFQPNKEMVREVLECLPEDIKKHEQSNLIDKTIKVGDVVKLYEHAQKRIFRLMNTLCDPDKNSFRFFKIEKIETARAGISKDQDCKNTIHEIEFKMFIGRSIDKDSTLLPLSANQIEKIEELSIN